MSKKIEKTFLIHTLAFFMLFVLLKTYMNFDIFKETYNFIDSSKASIINEFNIVANGMLENPSDYNMTQDEASEYVSSNTELINEAYYYMYYYMPAMYLLLILLVVLLENTIYRRLKLSYMYMSYDAKRDESKEKLKAIIREKLNYKYRRITLPKHVPIMCTFLYIATMFLGSASESLVRSVNNMIFALVAIITIYGLRVAIKFFKTKSEVTRVIVILLNICMGVLAPQIYFVIGFFKSLISIKIVIKNDLAK